MRLLITAGPTREPIDAVRYISNRSSGRMGLALAQAGMEADHQVTLLLGPGLADDVVSAGCSLFRFETAGDLEQLLKTHWPEHDLLIMAAAVADYRPAAVHPGKIRRDSDAVRTLELVAVDDLVAQMAAMKRADQRVVAFALEPAESLIASARDKLRRKGVDALVANRLEAMDAPMIDACWIKADNPPERPGEMAKVDFARWLIEKISCDLGI